jgi:hypothetical protein
MSKGSERWEKRAGNIKTNTPKNARQDGSVTATTVEQEPKCRVQCAAKKPHFQGQLTSKEGQACEDARYQFPRKPCGGRPHTYFFNPRLKALIQNVRHLAG